MKIIWASDIHLNFIGHSERREFYRRIRRKNGNIVVISGDIAESQDFAHLIKEMEDYTNLPVYFVLGNHDFYGSSIKAVKKEAKKLNWLGGISGVQLDLNTKLIGVDGWGDCRAGDYENSRLTMSDWIYIDELREAYEAMTYIPNCDELKKTLQELADKDASLMVRRVRRAAKENYSNIIIVSHVPPFEEACLYAGKKSTPSGLPFFCSVILGEKILPLTKEFPEINFTWLSGHTHSRGIYEPTHNLTVKVAEANYFKPQVEEVIEL